MVCGLFEPIRVVAPEMIRDKKYKDKKEGKEDKGRTHTNTKSEEKSVRSFYEEERESVCIENVRRNGTCRNPLSKARVHSVHSCSGGRDHCGYIREVDGYGCGGRLDEGARRE